MLNPERDDDEDEPFKIVEEHVLALLEIKRYPSRELTGDKLIEAQNDLMYRAQEDVFRQVLYLLFYYQLLLDTNQYCCS